MTISKYQRNNIVKLYNYLSMLPEDYEHFDMKHYHSYQDKDGYVILGEVSDMVNITGECITKCGTVACVAGHGPYAGIKIKTGDMFWDYYIKREFIDPNKHNVEWHFLFSSKWRKVAPSLNDAVQRLEYFILNKFKLANQWTENCGGLYFRYDMVDDWKSYLDVEIDTLRSNGAAIPHVE